MKKQLIIAAVLLTLIACGEWGREVPNGTSQQLVNTHADTLIFQVWMTDGYDRSIPVIDSLAANGELSPLRVEYYRGIAFVNIGQRQKSIDCFRRAIVDENPPSADIDFYISAGTCLAEGLLSQENSEGALRTALAIENKIRQTGRGLSIDIQRLYTAIGFCQIKLQRPAEAAKSFERAYHHVRQSVAADSTGQQLPAAIATLQSIAAGNLNANQMAEAEKWFNREDSLLTLYGKVATANLRYMDIFRSSISIGRAQIAQAFGNTVVAARHYADFAATNFGQSDEGLLNSCNYLMAADRYVEAADHFTVLDRHMLDGHLEMDLDRITTFMEKLRANYYAGRRDSALRVAMQIAEVYDSALVRQKHSDAAELATVYDTQGKERQIAEQQAELLKQRLWGIAGALALVIAFFAAYDLHRRRARRRLAAAHADLETAHADLQMAYDKLEETTAAKERIESELRIARDIQMSMVPSTFPDYDGLDLYAEMTPAKQVGGDLYGYLLLSNYSPPSQGGAKSYYSPPSQGGVRGGSLLYFCVGDVSGKGVPASLFMAQSVRLFQSLAKEGLMPADIASRMNRELAENNEQNMFVTMFIGLVDLSTGRLDFCNCGHNPPVIDGEFLEMKHPNMPLGLWADFDLEGEHIDDIRGRQILIYTDGLNEAMNPADEQFGDERLIQLMAQAGSLNAHQVIDMLTKSVEAFRDGAEPNDDLTLMCLHINSPETN